MPDARAADQGRVDFVLTIRPAGERPGPDNCVRGTNIPIAMARRLISAAGDAMVGVVEVRE